LQQSTYVNNKACECHSYTCVLEREQFRSQLLQHDKCISRRRRIKNCALHS